MKQFNNLTIKQSKHKSGALIVFEGIDGCGKTTQIELLTKSLKEKNIPFEVISFPRYRENKHADMVRGYLNGKFGSIKDIDPYFIAKAYAGDRLLAKPLIEGWLNDGKIVIANRYVSSSKAHLGANIPDYKRKEFFKWLDDLEYKQSFSANKENGMPREDLTILLVVDPKIGQQNVQVKQKPDIHEENLKHLIEAGKIYLKLAKSNSNWYVVECMGSVGMRTREDIHLEILKILQKYLKNEKQRST